MITVCMLDVLMRARDAKEIIAMDEMHSNDVKYIFVKTKNMPDQIQHTPSIPTYFIQDDVKFLIEICRKHNVNVIHSHNYPDNLGMLALGARKETGIPVVHECHDIGYENVGDAEAFDTLNAMTGADRIITVSEGMSAYLDSMYGVGGKCTIIYSYPNRKLIPKATNGLSRLCNRCVYEGGIRFDISSIGKRNHRYYQDIFMSIAKQGIKIDVYPSYNINGRVPHPNVKMMPFIPDVLDLYEKISTYDFGFVGYRKTSGLVMDMALPNKLFEYIACGIPIMAMDYSLIGNFVRSNGFGIVIDKSGLHIPKDYRDILIEAKKEVLKYRQNYTMECQSDKLFSIYKSVIK